MSIDWKRCQHLQVFVVSLNQLIEHSQMWQKSVERDVDIHLKFKPQSHHQAKTSLRECEPKSEYEGNVPANVLLSLCEGPFTLAI